jgi:hypothetical protein
MKNKKSILILLLATVGCLWGYIVWRIYGSYTGEETQIVVKDSKYETKTEILSSDTFSIVADYRDPFLGKEKTEIRGQKTEIRKPVPKAPKPVVTANWPAIVYGGMIRNQKSNQQLALLTMGGESNMLKTGDSYQEITVVKIYKDSIELKLGREKRVFRK